MAVKRKLEGVGFPLPLHHVDPKDCALGTWLAADAFTRLSNLTSPGSPAYPLAVVVQLRELHPMGQAMGLQHLIKSGLPVLLHVPEYLCVCTHVCVLE